MKLLVTLVLGTILSVSGLAQDMKKQVSDAFLAGNAKVLAKHFSGSVDLAVNDLDDVYSKVQAEQILKKFFDKHKPSSFKVVHDGESRHGVKYFIGELETSGGSYRVTVNMKGAGGAAKIHQLRIE